MCRAMDLTMWEVNETFKQKSEFNGLGNQRTRTALIYFTEFGGSQTGSSLPRIPRYMHMAVGLGPALDMGNVVQS
jgi:hypothetical protein